MNHKTIRAYQFKADEAVRTLEEAGAQWVVGKGKPHWELPIEPKENLENMRDEIRAQFAKEVNERMIAFMATLVPQEPTDVPVVDAFEQGPMDFPDRHHYINTIAEIVKIPSWHKLSREYIGHKIFIRDITKVSRQNYKGYCIVFQVGMKVVWLPLSCIKFAGKL